MKKKNSNTIHRANLSESYFTNRQDRYILIQDRALADYYCDLAHAVATLSYSYDAQGHVKSLGKYDLNEQPEKWKENALQTLHSFTLPKRAYTAQDLARESTWVFPTVQLGSIGLRHDEGITQQLMLPPHRDDGSHFQRQTLDLSSAYFNLTPQYQDALRTSMSKHHTQLRIITASPKANGFYEAEGLSRHIPALYTELEAQFLQSVTTELPGSDMAIFEYQPTGPATGWTYHAKGLWLTSHPNHPSLPTTLAPTTPTTPPTPTTNHHNDPYLTLVGSPNFGYRSVYRDLESQVAVVSTDPTLQRQLGAERDRLFAQALRVASVTQLRQADRRLPWHLRGLISPLASFL
eukprot:TRINITY_DN2874_c0_g1_i2.p1 TRINITY_DN2874_c0_g1~~TRINITY_DN2874_c0_g1_i2.p1  ORF type:complete len:349 (+),score=52.99 TRINITY_DN2874_c0_g1_i2:573-1619(+)